MKNKGFSLVELIVVIAIMAILVGVAVPVYTSYIGKANAAKDEQLLGEINSAFMVAAVDNNIDFSKLTSDNNKIIIDADGKVTFDLYDESTTDDVDLNADVAAILPGELTFKTIEEVLYNSSARRFEDDSAEEYDYNGTPIMLRPSDIAALKNSTFVSTMGVDNLMDKVDYVTLLSASLMEANASSTFAQLINSPDYGEILADFMQWDIDFSTQEGQLEFGTKVTALINDKMDLLISKGEFPAESDRSEGSDLYNAAYYQIVANNAVLNAAKNSSSASGDILTVLGKSDSKTEMLNTINAGESGKGLAQVSIAYAMYTAYAANNGLTVPEDPAAVLLALDSDQGFKNYINDVDGSGQAQKDLEGYLGAMNMINTNVESNPEAVEDILVNGFANDELVELLQGATE